MVSGWQRDTFVPLGKGSQLLFRECCSHIYSKLVHVIGHVIC